MPRWFSNFNKPSHSLFHSSGGAGERCPRARLKAIKTGTSRPAPSGGGEKCGKMVPLL
ncbi:hypothetical protein HMPREF0262_01630 [Clostridium sp. ATCC 29733]|nr:hypothetical protein HMPREF0262_01630 [Clostridium sp. ATCC 29733]